MNQLMTTLGLFFAILILVSNSYERTVEIVALDDTEQTIVSEISYEAVPSPSQEAVERNSYLVESIPNFEAKFTFGTPSDIFRSGTTKIFEIVFKHIISPNSP